MLHMSETLGINDARSSCEGVGVGGKRMGGEGKLGKIKWEKKE